MVVVLQPLQLSRPPTIFGQPRLQPAAGLAKSAGNIGKGLMVAGGQGDLMFMSAGTARVLAQLTLGVLDLVEKGPKFVRDQLSELAMLGEGVGPQALLKEV